MKLNTSNLMWILIVVSTSLHMIECDALRVTWPFKILVNDNTCISETVQDRDIVTDTRLMASFPGNLTLSLHTSNEPGELSQWPHHDDSSIICIIRPHRSTTYVDRLIVTNRVSWSVGPFVGRSVTVMSPAKTAQLIECRLAENMGGPKEPRIKWGSISHHGKGNFEGRRSSQL